MDRRKARGKRKLVFSGSLTTANAEALRRKLADALRKGSVEVSFGNVKDVDLSFLQLLCSALRTAEGASRDMTVAGDAIPPRVRELVVAAGMVTPLRRREDRFWHALAGRNTAGG